MWPFTSTPAAPNPVKEHFYSFKKGQTAYLLGRPVMITREGAPDDWDEEYDFIPELQVSWWNGGTFNQKSMDPQDVMELLTHEEA